MSDSLRPEPLFEEDIDYVNEDHIEAFAKALAYDDNDDPSLDDDLDSSILLDSPSKSGPPSPLKNRSLSYFKCDSGSTLTGQSADLLQIRPERIEACSDWLPRTNSYTRQMNRKHKKSAVSSFGKSLKDEFRSTRGYSLLRWPVLLFIILWMSFLSVCYALIRFYVSLVEYFVTWTGERKVLRDRLRQSKSYEEWVVNAKNLDKYLHLDKWSQNPRFLYYDSKTVSLTIARLRSLRESSGDEDIIMLLQGCLKSNFAGIENEQLYCHRYFGTKKLVGTYYREVVASIEHIIESKRVDADTKRRFFRMVLKHYGKSALCLSGGASFSYTHFGIVKALLKQDLLPLIILGTSGGGIVASLTCTRTNDELRKLLVPELARKITACEDPWTVWLPRWWRTGARFDAVEWARKSCFFTRGSMTFEEAYRRTGRKLNVSTVPADPHSPVILCNNITSPNCIIWLSLLASAAVPGILNPVVLMMKNQYTDEVVPFSLGSKWRDGSLRTDIPLDALNTYYNVTFPIVSQVNPHILLFFFAPKGTVGRPVAVLSRKTRRGKFAQLRGGFIASALEQLCKLEITKWLRMIKNFDLLPRFMDLDWLNIWLQQFSGSITIWPRIKLADFWYILSDPPEERLAEMILKGERSIWPSLHFILHRLSIERAIERGSKLARASSHAEDDEDQDFEGEGSDVEVGAFGQGLGELVPLELTNHELHGGEVDSDFVLDPASGELDDSLSYSSDTSSSESNDEIEELIIDQGSPEAIHA